MLRITTLRAAITLLVSLMPLAAAAQPDRMTASEDAPVFPVEAVNPGLPAAAEPPHLATPQSALEHFLRASREEDHLAAARALNLRFLAPDEQQARGPELARKLSHLLRSNGLIDWDRVPDRPDARVQALGPNQSSTFARRTVHLGSLDLGRMPVPVYLQRFALPDGTALWLFSPFTVEHIEALYEEHGPGLLQRYMPSGLEPQIIQGVTVWEWGALAALLGGAIILAWLLHRLIRGIAAAMKRPRLQYVLRRITPPLTSTAAAAAFYIAASTLLPLSGPFTGFIDPAALLVTLGLATWLAMRLIASLLYDLSATFVTPLSEERHAVRQLKTHVSVAQRIAVVLAFVVGVGVILVQLEIFDTLGLSLLASAGAVTVLLSLAARPLLGNLIAGIQIAATKPIRIGDVVEYEDTWARIEDIAFTYVVMKTWTDRRLIVPHTYLLERPLSNWSKRDDRITRIIRLFVDHRTDIALLRERYREIVRDDRRWTGENLRLEVVDVTAEGVEVWCWVSGLNSALSWDLQNDVREKLLAFLQDHEGGRFLPRERLIVQGKEPEAQSRDGASHDAEGPLREPKRGPHAA